MCFARGRWVFEERFLDSLRVTQFATSVSKVFSSPCINPYAGEKQPLRTYSRYRSSKLESPTSHRRSLIRTVHCFISPVSTSPMSLLFLSHAFTPPWDSHAQLLGRTLFLSGRTVVGVLSLHCHTESRQANCEKSGDTTLNENGEDVQRLRETLSK